MGPGKLTVAAGGLLGGLLFGCGIVLLITPIGPTTMRRRLSDFITAPFGRRASDRNGGERRAGLGSVFYGRRSTDASAAALACPEPPRRRSTDAPLAPSEPPRRRAEDKMGAEPAPAPRVYSEVS